MAHPIHRVTLLVAGDEPLFEEYARNDEVQSVRIEPNIGEIDEATGAITLHEEEEG